MAGQGRTGSAPRRLLKALFEAADRGLDSAFGPSINPFRHLGALGFYFLWVAFISGIYVYIFFDTGVVGAYGSLEALQRDQWWLGGVMRSLHRYGSDGLVLFMVLHLLRELAFDRYRGPRWFSWLTGTPVLWLIIIAGITGYWLVWDERAQYVAIVTAEWLDQLPLFGGVISRNFLYPGSLGDRFFTLLMFIHIAVPMFLLFGLWIHLQRVSRARIHAPRPLMLSFTFTLIVLSLLKPALSQAPANLARIPGEIDIDWFYLAFFPLFDGGWATAVWPVGALITVLLMMLPWMPPAKRDPAATVQLEHCNGCRRCVDDCPYNAVSMQARTDGRTFEEEAIVKADLCVACGICVGSCPSSTPFRRTSGLITGIDLPNQSLAALRQATLEAALGLQGDGAVIAFVCQHSKIRERDDGACGIVELPCIGALPPPFIDYVLSRGHAEGVYLEGCGGGECHNRFGTDWTEARIGARRDPYLRARVSRDRVVMGWNDNPGVPFEERLKAFRQRLLRQKGAET